MRRLLVVLALALLGGGVLYHLLSSHEGFVLISVGHYVVELSLWTALLLLVALYFLLKLLVRLYRMLFLPGKWWRWQAGRKAARIHNRTEQGLLDFFEGNWASAAANLRRAAPQALNPLLNYLGAAVAYFNGGDRKSASELLAVLEQVDDTGILAADLVRVRILLQEQRFTEALSLVQRLHREHPGHVTVLRLLASTYKGSGKWQRLEQLLPALKKNRVLTASELVELETEVYLALLKNYAAGGNQSSDQHSRLDAVWSRVPRRLQDDTEIFSAYIRLLQKQGKVELAEQRLRRQINRHWDDKLVRIYADLATDGGTQLTVAEAWLQDHPDNPELLLALGRICARNQLWGKARDYFEKAASLSDNPDTYYQLGFLYQELGENAKSADCFKRGLGLAV